MTGDAAKCGSAGRHEFGPWQPAIPIGWVDDFAAEAGMRRFLPSSDNVDGCRALATMARPLRLEFPGALYHVTSRGNARGPIFVDDGDRVVLLELLGRTVARHRWHCPAYCLMGNHYHLLIETPEADLSVGIRQLNGVYTQRFNRRHDRVGHLFQGRYKAILVDRESYLLELCRYIVLNPVRANIVDDPAQYPWSSYAATVGLAPIPDWLDVAWVLCNFGANGDVAAARRRYADFVARGVGRSAPWAELTGNFVLGRPSFVASLQRRMDGTAISTEVPRLQRFAHRPQLSILLAPEICAGPKPARDMTIRRAHGEFGYSMVEIAAHVGVHYSTVSKIVNGPTRVRS